MQSLVGAVATLDRVTILLVDDEEEHRRVVARLLRRALPEARVLHAADGEQALAVLGHEQVDLVLADYQMPRMDGLALAAAVRERSPVLPFVLVTAYPDMDLAMRGIHDVKISGLLCKPLRSASLVEMAGRLLGQRAADADGERCGEPARAEGAA